MKKKKSKEIKVSCKAVHHSRQNGLKKPKRHINILDHIKPQKRHSYDSYCATDNTVSQKLEFYP